MDQIAPMKPVREDWRVFNEAVAARAAYLKGLVVPRAQPTPPADWLRLGLGIGSVIVACGLATALVLWAIRLRCTCQRAWPRFGRRNRPHQTRTQWWSISRGSRPSRWTADKWSPAGNTAAATIRIRPISIVT
jgi:hypothetical protein